VKRVVAGAALSTALALGHAAGGGSPAIAEEQTFSFPASPDPELRAAQETLVEAYAYTKAYYLDPSAPQLSDTTMHSVIVYLLYE
jgi:hypothetical protein